MEPGADLGMVQHGFVAVDPGRDLVVVGQRGEVVLEERLHSVGPVRCGRVAVDERVHFQFPRNLGKRFRSLSVAAH